MENNVDSNKITSLKNINESNNNSNQIILNEKKIKKLNLEGISKTVMYDNKTTIITSQKSDNMSREGNKIDSISNEKEVFIIKYNDFQHHFDNIMMRDYENFFEFLQFLRFLQYRSFEDDFTDKMVNLKIPFLFLNNSMKTKNLNLNNSIENTSKRVDFFNNFITKLSNNKTNANSNQITQVPKAYNKRSCWKK